MSADIRSLMAVLQTRAQMLGRGRQILSRDCWHFCQFTTFDRDSMLKRLAGAATPVCDAAHKSLRVPVRFDELPMLSEYPP
jgi:hypothetical protein